MGEARGDRLGAGAATRRGAAGAPEKPPSADKEVFPPGNDLRDPRSAPGGPQPRSTVCRLDGFLLNTWGALGLPRPRRAGMLAEGLRKTPGAERLAGEEEKRDATGKPPAGTEDCTLDEPSLFARKAKRLAPGPQDYYQTHGVLNPCVGAAPCNKELLMPGRENTRISKRTHPRFTD